jgi:hypothetical protein
MKRQAQKTLDLFLCPAPKVHRQDITESASDSSTSFNPSVSCDNIYNTTLCSSASSSIHLSAIADNDIGLVYSHGEWKQECVAQLNDIQKLNLLTHHWMPKDDFNWPFYQKKSQKVYLRLNHISGAIYGCFKYSPSLAGVICIPCALFSNGEASNDKGKVTNLGKLVKTSLQVYKSLTGSGGYLDNHIQTQYHKLSQHRADAFLIMRERQDTVLNQLDSERKKQVVEQRQRLHPIIKTVELCGRLGIAYRGRRDDGVLDLDSPLITSDGNFRSLLRFRVEAGKSVPSKIV